MPLRDGGIVFLDIPDVLKIQRDQIALYGGGPAGIRDWAMVASAVHTPRMTFDGELLYEFPFDMAAAYMYHLIRNHGLLNGNKRTGSVSAMEFLKRNGFGFFIPVPKLRGLALRVEAGMQRADAAKSLHDLWRNAAQTH